ncbi:MAG: DUF885 domain-containing protein [Acidimicrobiales bacterium]
MTPLPTPAAAFRDAASEAVEDVLRHEPEMATALGDHRYDDRLDDRSEAGVREVASVYRRHRAVVTAIDGDALDADDRVDREVLLGALDQRLFALDELAETEWNPLVYNPGDALYPLVAREMIPLPDRLRAIAARLDQVPDLVALARRQLVRAPRVHLETALQQNAGTVSLVRDEVERLSASEPSMTATVEPPQRRALEALDRHGAYLQEMLDVLASASGIPTGVATSDDDGFRLGPQKFARKLELNLNSELSSAEVLQRANRHLDELSEQMEDACRRYLEAIGLASGSSDLSGNEAIRTALDEVAQRHASDETIVGEAGRAVDEAVLEVRENGLASLTSDAMVVQSMPEFRRGVAVAYCDAPGPLEKGGETFLAVAPTPKDWPSERVESFYREYNSAMVVNLIVHEAMPGHALQLAHGRRFSGSTPVRQVFMSGSFIEGWAVHAERLMAEAGHGGAAVKLQQLKMQLRMTINSILDAGVHAGGMTESQAMELMTVRGFQEVGEAAGKWRRACLTSAQLSTYFVGYTELADLFGGLGHVSRYDEVLSHGSPPPRLLRRLMRA